MDGGSRTKFRHDLWCFDMVLKKINWSIEKVLTKLQKCFISFYDFEYEFLIFLTFFSFFSWLQVEKIFGPGNQYVTAAKMILQVCLLFVDLELVLMADILCYCYNLYKWISCYIFTCFWMFFSLSNFHFRTVKPWSQLTCPQALQKFWSLLIDMPILFT